MIIFIFTMTDNDMLERFSRLLVTLETTQGTNAKVDVLRQHADLRPLISRVWNPETTTGVTRAALEKSRADYISRTPAGSDIGILDIMDELAERELSGNAAKEAVWAYIAAHPKLEDTVLRIVEKKPRVRLGETMLTKAFPDLYKEFKVCLAHDWDDTRFETQLRSAGGSAFMSQKLDGVRLITIIHGGTVTLYSRKGKPFTSLTKLHDDIVRTIVPQFEEDELDTGYVLDGEVYAVNADGSENFKETVSQVRKKGLTMDNPMYAVFDCIPLGSFNNCVGPPIYDKRLEMLEELYDPTGVPKQNLPQHSRMLPQHKYTAETFRTMIAEARVKKWEGIMVRMSAIYEGKRTYNLMKYKFRFTEEFRVKRVDVEQMPFPNASGGETRQNAVARAVIEYKGCDVSVGSGFDKAERLRFAEHPEEIVGKLISVTYQEPFEDKKKGTHSLRCPIFMGIVGAARDF